MSETESNELFVRNASLMLIRPFNRLSTETKTFILGIIVGYVAAGAGLRDIIIGLLLFLGITLIRIGNIVQTVCPQPEESETVWEKTKKLFKWW